MRQKNVQALTDNMGKVLHQMKNWKKVLKMKRQLPLFERGNSKRGGED